MTLVGVILGDGVPLFAGAANRHELTLISARDYPSGLVQLRYTTRPPDPA